MTITSITPQKRRAGRVSIFIDGAFAFGMENTDAERAGLREGMTLSRAQNDELLNKLIFARARDTALRYLSYKPRTLRETMKRLKEDEYPDAVIKRVLVLMVKYRYINDRQYARDYIEERARAHYGAFRIKRELTLRGVNPQIIISELERAAIDETESIIRLTERAAGRVNEDALRRRGYSYKSIKDALRFKEENAGGGE